MIATAAASVRQDAQACLTIRSYCNATGHSNIVSQRQLHAERFGSALGGWALVLGLGKHVRRKCPDGRRISVYRNPADAYPLEAPQWKARADTEVKALEHATAKAGLNVETRIDGVYLQLDQANRSVQPQLAAVQDNEGFAEFEIGRMVPLPQRS